jgi:hypothetical protein
MKGPLHFSTYRSGSVPIGTVLETYFHEHLGLLGLGDFFEPDPVLFERNAPRDRLPRGYLPKTYKGRTNFIKRHQGKYFFTIYPGHDPAFLKWLTENYDFIFSERSNLVQQCLSHLISEETNIWYREKGLNFKTGSVTARLEHFRFFERHVFNYFQMKSLLRPKKVINFEHFCEEGPEEALKKIGLRKKLNFEAITLPVKQNRKPKDKILTNIDEVKKWYEGSFAQDICPWKRGISKP